ncbi:MAG: nucleotidyltransferase domain-containing protein [Saprospiraceae bacterium]|nr:nucleotidyltransferase domain-containing protein [Saprospiraceae bacterium]
MISQEQIQEATRRLVEAYNPVAIYLFGSYAWGEPNEDSDLDLMVVVSNQFHNTYSSYKKGKWALRDMKIENDIVVENFNLFEQRASHPSNLEFKIQKEGKQLYGTLSSVALQS